MGEAEEDAAPTISVTRSFRETIGIWRRDLRSLTVLAAALEVPIVLADITMHVSPGLEDLVNGSLVLTGGALIVLVYGVLSHHFFAGVLERVVSADRHGHQRPSVGEVLRELPWGRLVAADLLLTAIIIGGLAAFVVPGLLALTWFAPVLPVITLEGRPVLPSFARSYQLVRGHSWRVAGVAVTSFAIPEFAIGFIAEVAHTGNHVLDALAHAVPTVILLPLAALPIVVTTFDLVAVDAAERSEGGGRVAREGDVTTSWLERAAPGVRAARTYRRDWLRADLIAGVVLAAVLVPQGMAYAELAGLPPVTGLYTTIACLVGYAVFGPSRVLVLGPDSSISPLIFAALAPLLVAGDDPAEAIALAGMLALIVGAFEIALGIGKLGFVADLLSSEVQVGYMNGLAVTIIAGQLPKLFGFSTDADTFGQEVRAFVESLDETDAATLVIGLGVLATLLLLPRLTTRVPAVLVGVVGATAISALLDLAADGVATVGALPSGFPSPSLPWTSVDDIGPLALAAIGITLVSLTDTIATASSFAARRGDEVEPDQEMIGIGAANVAASAFQGFAISTSGSRTAVAEQTGAKSQLTGVIGAGVVLVLLLFLNELLADLPQSALAAVVIAAALSLMDLQVLVRYTRVRPSAVVLSLVATVAVILVGVLNGIVVAIVLAILLFFRRSWWPHGAVLGRVDGVDGWHSIEAYPEAAELDGIVIYRWEAPLFFANAGSFRDQIRELVAQRRPSWVVLQCEAITDVDVTAAEVLEQLDLELNAAGVHMAFAGLRSRLHELIYRYGLFDTLDRDHFYPTLDAALASIADEAEEG